jgi:hypothetical protein
MSEVLNEAEMAKVAPIIKHIHLKAALPPERQKKSPENHLRLCGGI